MPSQYEKLLVLLYNDGLLVLLYADMLLVFLLNDDNIAAAGTAHAAREF